MENEKYSIDVNSVTWQLFIFQAQLRKHTQHCFLICVLCMCVCMSLFGQQKQIDSLFDRLKTDKQDTTRINDLLSLSECFVSQGDDDSALFYIKEGLRFCGSKVKSSNDTVYKKSILKGQQQLYGGMGRLYISKNMLADALQSYQMALKISESIYDQNAAYFYHSYIGYVYFLQFNYPEAINSFRITLKIAESIPGVSKERISKYYNLLGNVYRNQGNLAEALKSYLAALKISEETGLKVDLADQQSNIALVQVDLHNYQEASKYILIARKDAEELKDTVRLANCYKIMGDIYYDQNITREALLNYQTALKFAEAKKKEEMIANIELSMGNIYFDEGNYAEALNQYKCYQKTKQTKNDVAGMAAAYGSIANVYTKQKKYDEAEKNVLKGIDLAKGIGHKGFLAELYSCYSILDSAKGDYRGAFENHKLFIIYRDSLDNEETRKKTIQSQMTFDFEKKEAVATAEHKKELENQAAIADEKSRKQKIVLSFVVCGLLLVVVFAGFIFRSLRVTRKQKIEIESQKHLVEEKQKEILDSIHYAKRIQTSLLPTEKYIDKSLNRLKN